MTTGLALIAAAALAAQTPPLPATPGDNQAVSWPMDRLVEPPAVYPAEGFESPGVRALFYEGLPWCGKPTRVFAWYGVPEGAADRKHPAMVLVHGGGGTAFADWVRLWTGRGYAAIAMDTCGAVPRGTYGNWERHEYGGPPGWGGFDQLDQPLEDQWTFHAVADVILAHSLLRSFPEVDADRIGLTGISWGGYLTCIVAGVDTRFRLAVPVYGSGFLDQCDFLGGFAAMAATRDATADKARWMSLWDPSHYLPHAAMPTLWVTGPEDSAFFLPMVRASSRLPAGGATLSIHPGMVHGHGGPGENPEEIRAFTDAQLMAGAPLPRVLTAHTENGTARVRYVSARPLAGADLCFTRDTGPWPARHWEITPAALEPPDSASAAVPPDATAWFISLRDERGLLVSGEHDERP